MIYYGEGRRHETNPPPPSPISQLKIHKNRLETLTHITKLNIVNFLLLFLSHNAVKYLIITNLRTFN